MPVAESAHKSPHWDVLVSFLAPTCESVSSSYVVGFLFLTETVKPCFLEPVLFWLGLITRTYCGQSFIHDLSSPVQNKSPPKAWNAVSSVILHG